MDEDRVKKSPTKAIKNEPGQLVSEPLTEEEKQMHEEETAAAVEAAKPVETPAPHVTAPAKTPDLDSEHHKSWFAKRADFFEKIGSEAESHAKEAMANGHRDIAHGFQHIRDVAATVKKKAESAFYWQSK